MPKEKNILLCLEFEGTNYAGWQKQNNAIGISTVVESAIRKITQEEIKLIGCGRTDAGVHALCYYCNFITNSSIPPNRYSLALNSILPRDIVVKDSFEVDKNFHSRYSIVKKQYMYVINNESTPSALYRNMQLHVKKKLDMNKMKEAANYFIGAHDFRTFMASNSQVKDTHRIIYSLDIIKDQDSIIVEITGNGFLYNMVRIIVGTLIDVGHGKTEPKQIVEIIEAKDRNRAGKTVRACGLYMSNVFYENEK